MKLIGQSASSRNNRDREHLGALPEAARRAMADAAAPEGPAAVGAGGDVDGAANPAAAANQSHGHRPDLPPAVPAAQPLKDLQQVLQGEPLARP